MTQSEYEKKRDEIMTYAKKVEEQSVKWISREYIYEPEDGFNSFDVLSAFKAGSDFGREYQSGVEDELINNLIGRLHKMFCTGPNIEKEKREVRLALEAYEKSKDVK